MFLATEHYENVEVVSKGFLGFPKKKIVELTSMFSLFPLNSALLWIMANAMKLPLVKEVDKGGVEKEYLYETWDVETFQSMRDGYEKVYLEANDEKDGLWAFGNVQGEQHLNPVVDALAEEGHFLFGTYHYNRFLVQTWMVHINKRGQALFTLIYDAAAKNDRGAQTVKIDTFAFDRNTMGAVLAELGGSDA